VGDDTGAEIADGAGENFRNDGVVDVDVKRRFAMHGVHPIRPEATILISMAGLLSDRALCKRLCETFVC
jgi:hypothetical protein